MTDFEKRLSEVRKERKDGIMLFSMGSVHVLTTDKLLLLNYKKKIIFPFINEKTYMENDDLDIKNSSCITLEYLDTADTSDKYTKSIVSAVMIADNSTAEDIKEACVFVGDALVDANGEIVMPSTKIGEDINNEYKITAYKNGSVVDEISKENNFVSNRTITRDEVMSILDNFTAEIVDEKEM